MDKRNTPLGLDFGNLGPDAGENNTQVSPLSVYDDTTPNPAWYGFEDDNGVNGYMREELALFLQRVLDPACHKYLTTDDIGILQAAING